MYCRVCRKCMATGKRDNLFGYTESVPPVKPHFRNRCVSCGQLTVRQLTEAVGIPSIYTEVGCDLSPDRVHSW